MVDNENVIMQVEVRLMKLFHSAKGSSIDDKNHRVSRNWIDESSL